MEELLERQWEHSSKFLMEQSSYFDIASLLSSLHQFKEENNTLEDVVDRLLSKRDRLLAVNARLLALDTPHLTAATQQAQERQESSSRRGLDPPPPSQNGPSSGVDKRLVSPSNSISSRVHISPGPLATPHEKPLPSPRDRPLPSPRERMVQPSSSVRDRDRSPRLPPHHGMENGLDSMYGSRGGQSQLLTVAHSNSSSQHHRQHSPSGPPPPKPAHYPHNASLPPQAHSRHPELRGGHYPPSSYQMVSPPAPKGMVGGPPLPPHQGGPLPAHSVHPSHRSTPPRHHPPPPHGHGPPPSAGHHNTPPSLPPSHLHSNMQQLMRVSPQSQLHHKK